MEKIEIGNVYGNFKVIDVGYKDSSRHIFWKCRCENCGEIAYISTYNLKHRIGRCKNCGRKMKDCVVKSSNSFSIPTVTNNDCYTDTHKATVLTGDEKHTTNVTDDSLCDVYFYDGKIKKMSDVKLKELTKENKKDDVFLSFDCNLSDSFCSTKDNSSFVFDDCESLLPFTYEEYITKKIPTPSQKVLYVEKNVDLLSLPVYFHIAHCIPADLTFHGQTAKRIDSFYNMKKKIEHDYKDSRFAVGEVIWMDNVFNMIVNKDRYDKVTMENLYNALCELACYCVDYNIKYLAMPRICCGSNKLNWEIVRPMIIDIFNRVFDDGTFINITFCYQ